MKQKLLKIIETFDIVAILDNCIILTATVFFILSLIEMHNAFNWFVLARGVFTAILCLCLMLVVGKQDNNKEKDQ